MNKPTLVLAHNKTLAGQLYAELKELFPDNHVEYFVSYYENTSNPVLFSAIECYLILKKQAKYYSMVPNEQIEFVSEMCILFVSASC